MQLFIKIEHFT